MVKVAGMEHVMMGIQVKMINEVEYNNCVGSAETQQLRMNDH